MGIDFWYGTRVHANAADFRVQIKGTKGELIAYLVLILWPTLLALPLLLLIFIFSKRCKRHITLLNMFITWMISGSISGILLYTGTATGPEPLMFVCFLQAALLCGTQPMLSMSTFLLILQMHSQIRTAYKGLPAKKDSALRLVVLLAAPYASFILFSVLGALAGSSEPRNLSRDRRFFYCSLFNGRLTNAISLYSAALLLASVVLTVRILLMVRQRWTVLRSKGKSFLEFGLVLRIIVFGFYAGGISSLQLFSIASPSTPIPDLIFATTPSVVFLMFGSQADVMRVVCFWKRSPREQTQFQTSSAMSTPKGSIDQLNINFTQAVWSNVSEAEDTKMGDSSWERVSPPPLPGHSYP